MSLVVEVDVGEVNACVSITKELVVKPALSCGLIIAESCENGIEEVKILVIPLVPSNVTFP